MEEDEGKEEEETEDTVEIKSNFWNRPQERCVSSGNEIPDCFGEGVFRAAKVQMNIGLIIMVRYYVQNFTD